ncbi:hypothetical protein ANCDUO_02860 [Ancylostoma duodenale]|uniref:Uncharacterized protein n=1 Tax=Ancylostoma duodenale TaxID=51022 RepID=A0A0C2GZ99_9BILA|nr:hypothetical protein ANCDUO_02860 [Ancylostoma duodenale]
MKVFVSKILTPVELHGENYYKGYWLIGVYAIWLMFVIILSSPWAAITYIPDKWVAVHKS